MISSSTTVFLAALLAASAVHAGAYYLASSTTYNNPAIIVHPYGYSGAGAALTVRVCAIPSAISPVDLRSYIQAAVAFWNSRPAGTSNCAGPCILFGEARPAGPYNPTYVLTHELGHCAMGLDETHNEDEDTHTGSTNHTNSFDENSISDGLDGIPGTADDRPDPYPGTRVLHWARIGINDPFFDDGATISNANYSRRISDLPPGDLWTANGNKGVAEHEGYPVDSHSVMFGKASPRTTFSKLLPDDLNTVMYGQRGLDEFVSGDDYTLTVEFVNDCTTANVEVSYEPLNPNTVGECGTLFTPLPIPGEPTVRHYAMDSSVLHAVLRLNTRSLWEFNLVLLGDFDTGDTSQWSSTTP